MTKDASTTPHFSSESNPQEVAIAVIVRPSAETNGLEHEILAAWREKGAIRGGNWELPGGKVEAGESISAAAARETLEEMGLEIETGDLLTSSEDLDHSLPRENHVKVHAVMATLAGKGPSDKHPRTWRWIPISELSNYTWPKANEKLNLAIEASLRAPE